MQVPIYQVDAFAEQAFTGNPAAVCVLDNWLADATLQNIALENNLSETAFLVKQSEQSYALRWFTPGAEVDLCGHATMASAFVVFEFLQPELSQVDFLTASGVLSVNQSENGLLSMNFPARPGAPMKLTPIVTEALGCEPVELLLARDLLLVFEDEKTVRELRPDMQKMLDIPDGLGVIATAPGTDDDFVSRFFAPKVGVPEDPVTGSAHCTLIPYWATRLKKNELKAKQISARTGMLLCLNQGNRVIISGHSILYLIGHIMA